MTTVRLARENRRWIHLLLRSRPEYLKTPQLHRVEVALVAPYLLQNRSVFIEDTPQMCWIWHGHPKTISCFHREWITPLNYGI